MDCQHLDQLYEMYLLGGIGGSAAEEIEAHVLRGCRHCLDGLREAAETVYCLLQNAGAVRPRPAVRTRLAERLKASAPQAGAFRKLRPFARSPLRGGR
jgi:hypothetical protein